MIAAVLHFQCNSHLSVAKLAYVLQEVYCKHTHKYTVLQKKSHHQTFNDNSSCPIPVIFTRAALAMRGISRHPVSVCLSVCV